MFGRSAGGVWISGALTAEGAVLFRRAKLELEALYRSEFKRAPGTVSKSSVVEYVLRGKAATLKYFRGRRNLEE